jgi:hypothetical protein
MSLHIPLLVGAAQRAFERHEKSAPSVRLTAAQQMVAVSGFPKKDKGGGGGGGGGGAAGSGGGGGGGR